MKINNKVRQTTIQEDHYSLVAEPGSKYIGHVTPASGTSSDIMKSIKHFFSNNECEMNELCAVGCAGTVVNTGVHSGVIRLLEIDAGKPLQWFICLLHFNELPFRHLFQSIDGLTSGPNSFSGPIGKMLKVCVDLPVVKFKKIESNLPFVDEEILSTDQKYLYKLVNVVKLGHCAEDVANLEPGNLNHSRWLTTANRVLRLYISTSKPENGLKTLTTFIVKVYAPSWFRIKIHESVKNGAKHLLDFIQSSRYLPKKYLEIIDPVIERNAYFASPENILLSMLTDENIAIRRLAMNRILEAKLQERPNDKSVRQFKIPNINFKANVYYEIIDWSSCDIYVPPVLNYLNVVEIQDMVKNKKIPAEWEFSRFPCHTPSVERMVKLVTKASSKVYGFQNRNNFIKATLKSRSAMPKFETKKDFQLIKF